MNLIIVLVFNYFSYCQLQPSTAIFPEPYKPEDKSDKALGEKLII